MADGVEVTLWLKGLAQGDQHAAQQLWENYCTRLFGLARRRLGDLPRRAFDEEDIALSAFNSFCKAAQAGRLPQLQDRTELWRVLVTITARKAVAQLRHDFSQKRGGAAVRGESVFQAGGSADDLAGIGQVMGKVPSPEFAAEVSDECRRLLDLLNDPVLKSVALFKLEGYTNDEIAAKLECSAPTVERKLARIRKAWENEVAL